jgi:hypothetical protein
MGSLLAALDGGGGEGWRWPLGEEDESMRGALWTGSVLPVGGVSARRLRMERLAVGGPMMELCGGVGWKTAALGCEAR